MVREAEIIEKRKIGMKSKLLSIYLPQFHTIPENDEWWGKGFTEWTNVKRGHPFYPGHYQPREPLHDDYYDLSDLKVLERHTREARKAGIYGFCFYHYYFQGRTLLEKPIEAYRDVSKEQFPYCLIWANQSWARTWYRANIGSEVLLRQAYGIEEDWKRHFYYLLPFFKDSRYIKIDNKPVYIMYLPQDICHRREMFALWRKLARENGFDDLYLIAMNTGMGRDGRSRLYDAFMDFEPLYTMQADHSWRRYLQEWKRRRIDRMHFGQCDIRNWVWSANSYSYTFLCRKIESRAGRSDVNIFGGVFAGWDNTSRKDENGVIITGSTPRKFQRHLKKMLAIAEKQEKEFVFLNAWNEWSEGAYVEPDKKYGWGYLKAIQNVACREGDRLRKWIL